MSGVRAARRIRITAGKVVAEATLNGSRAAEGLWRVLPVEARAERWGDEVYFDIGVTLDPEMPREVVEVGDVAYWPPGRALCLFFGSTPASRGGEIRPASPVTVVGRLDGDPRVFRKVRPGTRVRVETIGG